MMRLWKCCCEYSFVVGSKQVYGPIVPMGLSGHDGCLMTIQRMMPAEEFRDDYADCAACYDGSHKHVARHAVRP